jgi:hypothetical protein
MSDKPKFVGVTTLADLKIFMSQPQIQFRLPEGPHHIEEEDGLVHLVDTATGRAVLTMPASVAPALGYTPDPPEPPKSGVRLGRQNRNPR